MREKKWGGGAPYGDKTGGKWREGKLERGEKRFNNLSKKKTKKKGRKTDTKGRGGGGEE